jgi:hypothetical protein
MSEYQYVAFRAIDDLVSEDNLAFMRRQSTRARITSSSFENEYHFGSFHGNALEMLRRGYDFHFHYANYGIRRLKIRLPFGLPDPRAAEPYFDGETLYLDKDEQGPEVVLCLEPFYESGYLDNVWDPAELFERLLPLRAELLAGDLRPLYLAHLAVVTDNYHDPDQEKEGPVPAGLGKLTNAQRALMELYGISDALIAAVAENSPPLPEQRDIEGRYAAWLQRQPKARTIACLAQWMADPHGTARRELLVEFQQSQTIPAWPTVNVGRTIAELEAAAEVIQDERDRKADEQATRQRAKKLADMAADPRAILGETEELVKQRNVEAYQEIATLLADLREALAGSKQANLPEKQALALKTENPTLHRLTGALRAQGFVLR